MILRTLAMAILVVGFAGCGEESDAPVGDSKGSAVPAAPAAVSDVKAFMDRLGQALRDRDDAEIRRLLAAEVTVRLLDRQDMIPPEVGDLEKLAEMLEQVGTSRLSDPVQGIGWERYEIQLVQSVEDGAEAIVYARHWDAADLRTRMRWWLCRVDGEWQMYDFEILDAAFQFSTGLAMGLRMGSQRDPAARQIPKFLEAVALIAEGDNEGAVQGLMSLEDAGFPPLLESMRLVGIAGGLLDAGSFAEAVEYADRALESNRDLPMVHLLYAAAYNGLGRHDEAIAAADRYAEVLGKDSDYWLEIGDAQVGKGDHAGAWESYRLGLKDDDSAGLLVLALLRSLPPGDKKRVGEAYLRLNDLEAWFEGFSERLIAKDDADSLEALLELHRAARPDDPNITLYEESLKLLRKGR